MGIDNNKGVDHSKTHQNTACMGIVLTVLRPQDLETLDKYLILFNSTVEPFYNTIVFHQNTHKRHPIARP